MLTNRRNLALACSLSALAGYVDGIGFIHLGGLFVSFMSGNSTRLGVALADGHYKEAAAAGSLIALFVLGAGIGTMIVRSRSRYRQAFVLLAEGCLLGAAAAAAGYYEPIGAVVLIVMAMGLENAVFQMEGGAGLGLTYMTGALVKVGQSVAEALRGGPPFAFAPHLALWAALVVGAVVGALAYRHLQLTAIWFAAFVALALAALVAAGQRRKGFEDR